MIKQRSESIEVYKKNNRQDLLEVEEGEVQIISEYLPKQLSEEETTKVCKEIVEKIGAKSVKDGVFSVLKGDSPTNSLPLFFKLTVLDTTLETFNLVLISSKYSLGYFIFYSMLLLSKSLLLKNLHCLNNLFLMLPLLSPYL